jgi:hypothetical protein
LEWVDENNNNCSLNCFYEDGTSKGLFEILKELNLIPINAITSEKDYALPKLIEIAKKHPAFEIDTNLTALAIKYDIRVIYLPKFHSELSPIEGVWAHEKQHIRKNTDQTFPALRRLLTEARNNLFSDILIPKLWRRFWRAVESYSNGVDFQEILTNFFGVKCKVECAGHRQIQPIKNTRLNF